MKPNTFNHLRTRSLATRSILSLSSITTGVCVALASLLVSPAHSAPTTWTGSSSVLWNDAGSWSAGVPGAGSDATLGLSGATVVYLSGSNPVLNSLTISAAGGTFLSQSLNSLTAVTEVIGDSSKGEYDQTNGINTVTGSTGTQSLILGNTTGGNGTYNISGGTLNAKFISVGGGNSGLGSTGTGTFIQSGASSVQLDISTPGYGQLYIGNAAGTTASYTLAGGALDAQNEFIALTGANGGGRSFVQTGGTNTLHYTGVNSGQLQVGGNFSGSTVSSGTYTLSGPSSVLTAADEIIGVSGNGTFIQNDGINNITGGVAGQNRTLYVGAPAAGGLTPTGTYKLNNGTLNADYEYIGNPGSGNFTQAGGVNNVSQQLAISTSGTYTMNGGSLIATGTDPVYQAIENDSVFNLNGGTVTANGSGLINTGTFTLTSGGQLNGSGTKLNAAGGLFNAQGGLISSSGTTGVLTNSGTMRFTGTTTTTVSSVVQNNVGGRIEVTGAVTVFTKKVTNLGTIKVTNATPVFKSTYVEGGTTINDPTYEDNYIALAKGAITNTQVTSDSLFKFGANITISSTNNTVWNTLSATMEIYKGGISETYVNGNTTGDHAFQYSGLNLGQSYAGYVNNFAWLNVTVDSGNQLQTTGGGALYATELNLGGKDLTAALSQLSAFTGDLTIYYDAADSYNAYLNNGTYAFGTGSGQVAPVGGPLAVPEPSSIGLMAIGALGMSAMLRRKLRLG